MGEKLAQKSKKSFSAERIGAEAWSEIRACLSKHQSDSENGKHWDTDFATDFELLVHETCIPHNFRKDSVGRRVLDYYGADAWAKLNDQENARLRLGFKSVCQFVFGQPTPDAPNPQRDFFFARVKKIGHMPRFLEPQHDIVMRALLRGDADFFERLAKSLRAAGLRNPKSVVLSHEQLPLTKVETELYRHWTNPDFPLWMMGDNDLKLALQLLTRDVVLPRALHKKIELLGLKRFPKRPLHKVKTSRSARSKRLRFDGFEFSKVFSVPMKGVPVHEPSGLLDMFVGNAGDDIRTQKGAQQP